MASLSTCSCNCLLKCMNFHLHYATSLSCPYASQQHSMADESSLLLCLEPNLESACSNLMGCGPLAEAAGSQTANFKVAA